MNQRRVALPPQQKPLPASPPTLRDTPSPSLSHRQHLPSAAIPPAVTALAAATAAMDIGALVDRPGAGPPSATASSDRADSPLSSDLDPAAHPARPRSSDISMASADEDADADADADVDAEGDEDDEHRPDAYQESSDDAAGDPDDDAGYDPKPRRKQTSAKLIKRKKPSKSKATSPSTSYPQSPLSDSDYASNSKKKPKKARTSAPMSRRAAAARAPNYRDEDKPDWLVDSDAEGSDEVAQPVAQEHYETEDEIEMVLGHSRDEEMKDDPEDKPTSNMRFHIKWKGFSHLHNTEEAYEFLKRYKGLKRVDNYIKNVWARDAAFQARRAAGEVSPEEIEAYQLEKERVKENLEQCRAVERVVCTRSRQLDDGSFTTDYFIKWKGGLTYEHCTWENNADIVRIAQAEIDAFEQREASGLFPYRSQPYHKDRRPRPVVFREDPEYIKCLGVELKDFQLTGLNWLAYIWSNGINGILADEMGLGKTVQSTASGENARVSLLNIAMECKKAANHPFLFDGAEVTKDSPEETLRGLVMNSGKMVLLDKLLGRLKQDGHRVLIFSQMVRLLDILSDYMSLRGYLHQRLDGTVPSDVRKRSIEHFNSPNSPDFAFLLSTRAGGLGINLETADTVIIFDSDWNPQNDLQAMARAHRIGQKSHVSVYRFVSKGTVEEDVLERAKRKMVLEYAIINQLDTTQSHLGPKPASAKADFSKEELSAILKFGAQNMFKADELQLNKQLDEMDLDDILNHAEAHETVTAGGDAAVSSLGGEAFLANMAAITDVSTDMLSWDDIIPLEEREKFDEAEAERNEAEAAAVAAQGKKRAAAQIQPGAYEGMDAADASTPSGGQKKAKTASGLPRKTAAQRSMELKERDLRVLVRSLQRWGDIRLRFTEIVKEARLEDKNPGVVINICDEILELCERALAEHREQTRIKASQGQPVGAASKSKAVLVTFRSVANINAETVVSRFHDLRILDEHIGRMDDPYTWMLPVENIRPTLNWSGKWGPEHDAALLIGAWKHGFGNWEKIQEDPQLGLQGKFFLEEGKKGEETGASKPIPNAIHLVRRGDYLLGILREHDEKIKSYQSSLTKRRDPKQSAPSHSMSPAPSLGMAPSVKRRMSPAPAPHDVGGGDEPPRKKRHATPEFTDSDSDECPSMDEAQTKEELRPVKKQLKLLKGTTDSLSREEKVTHLKDSLAAIGARIETVVAEHAARGESAEKWRKHLWIFVTYFWPRDVKARKLQAIHQKITGAAAPTPSPKVAPAVNGKAGKSNGGSQYSTPPARAPGSSRSNGSARHY
ncbi:hypothetical protein FS749_001947 [Ceratobasidium sp. UAMH 11750]|nr:hypothetical protein FS749_001947 [Ceratobasidium sp. UAMH 11750]